MIRRLASLRSIACREEGVAAIEFCLTLPLLLALTLGVYDVSRLIAARLDYQQAVTEAAGLAIAQPPQNDLSYLVNAVAAAAKVPTSKVSVSRQLRCNGVAMPTTAQTCASTSDERAWFVSISVEGRYVPFSTHFALDHVIDMRVARTVRVQ